MTPFQAVSAADAACAMLHARFGPPASMRLRPGLEPFQVEALERIRAIIDRYGGALLADSVGLGKTHVAAALIREEVSAGGHVLVTGPAQLAAHWRRHLRGVAGWEWLSHTSLSRGRTPTAGTSLVVVDEAHAFRNPHTRRRRALILLASEARVLLITATPVNNSVMDFYNLVRLFARRPTFADVGVADTLRAAEQAERGDPSALRRVVECVMVRRTRELVQTSRLVFPRRAPLELIGYDLDIAYPGLLDELLETIATLRFPAHLAADRGAAELMRLSLLKRLESGAAAFSLSLERLERLLDCFIEAAADGRWFDVVADRAFADGAGGAMQRPLSEVAFPEWPPWLDRHRLIGEAEAERDRVRAVRAALAGAAVPDPKITLLRELIAERFADEKVLVFTEYRDTAVALWAALARLGGMAMVHGNDARLGADRAARATVLRRFAPAGNGSRPPPPHQAVRVLIATDVLAEGLNLQDARVVVSYDMPWNPVRLAQRIGRIDRLGSPHSLVVPFAFRPDRSVDRLLGLSRRVRRKLRAIRQVGGDAPWLAARGHAAALVPLDTLSASETLRQEYARTCTRGRTPPAADAVTLGILCDDGGKEGALFCLVLAGRTRFVFVPRRGRIEVDPPGTDALLQAALASPADAEHTLAAAPAAAAESQREPDTVWLRRADSRARRALVSTVAATASVAEPYTLRAGRRVRRWLASRTGGATPEELAAADRILTGLRERDSGARPPREPSESRTVAVLVIVSRTG